MKSSKTDDFIKFFLPAALMASYNDVGVKSPGLRCLRIVPCCALSQSYPIFAYRGIYIPLLCSYRGGSQGLSPTYEQAHVGLDLLTLASYNIGRKVINKMWISFGNYVDNKENNVDFQAQRLCFTHFLFFQNLSTLIFHCLIPYFDVK